MYSEALYEAYQRRKSFHMFLVPHPLGADGRREVEEKLQTLTPLYGDIRTELVMVDRSEVSSRAGADSYVLFYSEKKDGWLENIGYLGEQLDVWCASKGIGAIWLGLGKTEAKTRNGLDYVIMMGLSKVDEDRFRLDRTKAKRKDLSVIWEGEVLPFADDARYAPSACNSQPWKLECRDHILSVYRHWKNERVGLMSPSVSPYYNRIDMGILLYILELSMVHYGIESTRVSFPDTDPKAERTLVAQYGIK